MSGYKVTLEAIGSAIQSKTARLCHDDLLNGTLIEKIEDFVVDTEILDSNDDIVVVEEKLKNIIHLDEKSSDPNWLLDKLDKFKKSKHYHHLRHLSSLHDTSGFRLRMTGKPISFIFSIRGALDYHLVWETYETEEATYIWKLQGPDSQSRQKAMTELLEKVKWLRARNKMKYIQSKPPNFKRIEHDYSQENNALDKWKTMLSEYIT